MSRLQSQIKSSIDALDKLVDSAYSITDNNSNDAIDDVFHAFMRLTWNELPLTDTDGSALATVSCMPLWELMNRHTSTCAGSAVHTKAMSVQLLSTMYPKSKDRRCLYQQLSSYGTSSQNAVPLITSVPTSLPLTSLAVDGTKIEYIKALEEVFKMSVSGAYAEAKNLSTLSSLVRKFIDVLLPQCVLNTRTEEHRKTSKNEILITWSSRNCEWSSGGVFRLALWCLLLAAEFSGLPESKELVTFLRFSRWSAQTVEHGVLKTTYSEFLRPVLDSCVLCASLNPRVVPTAVDTVPLFDPRMVPILLRNEEEKPCTNICADFCRRFTAQTARRSRTPLYVQREKKVKDYLDYSIPREIEFMGTSSSCRDFDQVAYLCRDCLFIPTPLNSEEHGIEASKRRDMLFSRKRRRSDGSIEGPCFVPVKTSLSEVLEKANAESLVTLERLCSKWSPALH